MPEAATLGPLALSLSLSPFRWSAMSEPGGGEDGSAGLEVSAVQNVADVAVLQKHLRKLVPLLLEDGGDAPAALEAALEEKSALEQMRKFLSDPQVHTVLVERSTLKGARRPLPGRVEQPGCPDRQRPHRGVALSPRLVKMAELGGDGVSRSRLGTGPHPCLQSHMSFFGFDSCPSLARFGKSVSSGPPGCWPLDGLRYRWLAGARVGRPWAPSISAVCGCLRVGLHWPHSIVVEWVYLPVLQTRKLSPATGPRSPASPGP